MKQFEHIGGLGNIGDIVTFEGRNAPLGYFRVTSVEGDTFKPIPKHEAERELADSNAIQRGVDAFVLQHFGKRMRRLQHG